MTNQNSTTENRTKIPGFSVFIGTITGSFLLERTMMPEMTDLLPGPAWNALCRMITLLISAVFWMFIVPDLLDEHARRKARKVDGSHEEM